jgi:hypothetical protein
LVTNALDPREKAFYWAQMRWMCAKRVLLGTNSLDARETRSIWRKCAGCACERVLWSQIRWMRAKRALFGANALDVRENALY